MTRKQKLLHDIRVHHQAMRLQDPESQATEEELAECRRLIREKRVVRLTEGEELHAIHGVSRA